MSLPRAASLIGLLALGGGCPPAEPVDSGWPPDDTSPPEDSGAVEHGEGLLLREGRATVGLEAYEGHEDVVLLSELGVGEAVCRIRCTVHSVASRDDCGESCLWSFELALGPAEVLVDFGACEAAGYDAAAIAGLEGTTRAYGFIEEHVGHADVLVVDEGQGWEVAAYASWDPDSGALSYEWEQGFVSY